MGEPTPPDLEKSPSSASHDAAQPKPFPGEVTTLPPSDTHRGLNSRHIQFLALGGCIGTGLFVGSGQTMSMVGPGEHLCARDGLYIMLTCGSSLTYGIYCYVHNCVFCYEYAGTESP
jgi:amino acid permease